MQNVSKCSDTPKNRAANSPRFLTVSLTSLSRYTLKGKNFIFNYLLLVAVFFFFLLRSEKGEKFSKKYDNAKVYCLCKLLLLQGLQSIESSQKFTKLINKSGIGIDFPVKIFADIRTKQDE